MARTKATTKKTVTSTGKKGKASSGVTQHQLKLIQIVKKVTQVQI